MAVRNVTRIQYSFEAEIYMRASHSEFLISVKSSQSIRDGQKRERERPNRKPSIPNGHSLTASIKTTHLAISLKLLKFHCFSYGNVNGSVTYLYDCATFSLHSTTHAQNAWNNHIFFKYHIVVSLLLNCSCAYCSYMITKFKYEQNYVDRQNTQLPGNIKLLRLSVISFTCKRVFQFIFHFFLHFYATSFRSNAFAFMYEAETCVVCTDFYHHYYSGQNGSLTGGSGFTSKQVLLRNTQCELFLFANVPLLFRSFCKSIFCWVNST